MPRSLRAKPGHAMDDLKGNGILPWAASCRLATRRRLRAAPWRGRTARRGEAHRAADEAMAGLAPRRGHAVENHGPS